MPNNKRLIEEWLPIREIGVESRRERAASSALPPLYFLHVWWARRPLTASRAAILGALLPAWEGNEALLRRYFPDEEAYHAWFKRMLGILGDPVAARAKMDAIRRGALKLEGQAAKAFTYPRAFRVALDDRDIKLFRHIISEAIGTGDPLVLDSMAGGGSIPFEALRLGLSTYASEINPVACVILEATLRYPLKYGASLAADIEAWGRRLMEAAAPKLEAFYPQPFRDCTAMARLWVRTVPCPATGKPVPLSPNWWLKQPKKDTDEAVAVHLLCQPDWPECRFEIVRGPRRRLEELYAPDQGTVRRGNAISPWTGDPIPGDYIKRCAQEGKMGAQLYAVEVVGNGWREFRAPPQEEEDAVRRAEAALKQRWQEWLAKGLIPTEEIPPGHKTDEPRRYGMDRWYKMFSPRQLLALVTYLEALLELAPQMERELGKERAAAVRTYLALVLDKCAMYNCITSRWHPGREVIAGQFERHDFSFKWSFAEMNMALKDRGGFAWALSQVVDAYKGLCELLEPSRHRSPSGQQKLVETADHFDELHIRSLGQTKPAVTVLLANAAALQDLKDASVDAIIVDPPYGNNVMYAELSDFFYVWLKRSVGDLYPEWFKTELTDKHQEAVANPALFRGQKGNPMELATRDYLLKMRRIFREMRRVVKPQGVMVVMFTHRETEMWNALGLALLETGWEIGSSWPVHTESEHSLHQARKNAARSTILLFCRPRQQSPEPSYWDQALQQEVRATARRKAREYQEAGIEGVDLYLATYGPVLGVLSRYWPIFSAEVDRETGQPVRLAPEEALRIARREVFAMRKEQLLQGRSVTWDPATEWYILAWDTFKAREFPFDEARKLAISVGIDVTDLIKRDRLLGRTGDTVHFLMPKERLGEAHVNPKRVSFTRLIDGLHTAMWLYEEEGERECRRFLESTGYLRDRDFKALVEAAIKSIPRTRKYSVSKKGQPEGFLLPEAETLERMRVTFFPDIEPPREPLEAGADQGRLEAPDDEEEE